MPTRIPNVSRRSTLAALLTIGVLAAASATTVWRDISRAPGALGATGVGGDRALTPLFGIAREGLVRLDPQTLHALPGGGLPLDRHTFGWSFSPDRAKLAIGSDGSAEVRLVDLRRWRVVGDVRVRLARGSVFGTAWAGPSRVLAVVVSPGCCGLGDTTVAGIDARKPRLLWQRQLYGSLQAGERFRRSLVLVLGPPGRSLGASRLMVVGADGHVRSARLDQIRSGLDGRAGGITDIWNPGLAIDPAGARAFIVQAGEPVAEVDLHSLQVRYHHLSQPISLLGRLRDWLEPKAKAKADEGPSRQALWLGNGLLAVTGFDGYGRVGSGGREAEWQTPAGLKLIDTRTWSIHTLDSKATNAMLASDALVAYGSLWDSRSQKVSGNGLTVYNLDGSRRYHRYGDEPVSVLYGDNPVSLAGGRVMVGGAADSHLFRRGTLLDLRTGRELRRVRFDIEPLLADQPFWY